ncbi:VOC family protein [Gordonia crocea]|uniref:VOC family protein n=1 Tax=Gordonia crocea TaxID=589162 RepID=A0A7I9UYV9_9ACTN|nr:VOC family protein [Gordonia crocea]GED98358.1 VOC family protein [Gordonia crocea]
MSFHAYIFFSGNCAEAFERYHAVFGGDLSLMRNGDAPPDARMPGVDDSVVMHASLKTGDGLLMGSDDPSGDDGRKVGFTVSYTAPTVSAANSAFDALAEGGEVTMPMSETFWAKAFGMCIDRFGVPWMVDVGAAQDD